MMRVRQIRVLLVTCDQGANPESRHKACLYKGNPLQQTVIWVTSGEVCEHIIQDKLNFWCSVDTSGLCKVLQI